MEDQGVEGLARGESSSLEPQMVARAYPSSHHSHYTASQIGSGKTGSQVKNATPILEAERTQNFFTSLQWSQDGTTLLLPTATHTLTTYLLPEDLLDPPSLPGHHILNPYDTHQLPEPSSATVLHPSYNVSNPAACLYITSPLSLPIRLLSPFAPGILASYPLVNPTTEAWIAPHSLLFNPREENTFYAGADGFVAVFDLQRNGEGPVYRLVTGRGRRKRGQKISQRLTLDEVPVGCRGIVSALAMSSEGNLAAGTFQGGVGLVDTRSEASSAVYETLPLPSDAGTGITSLHWHPQPFRASYLVAASRSSFALHVFDVRSPGSVLATLVGRAAMTPQRLGVDVTENGEVWAGGADGTVQVWEGLGMVEGDVEPTSELTCHADAIGGLGLHPGGAGVLATCAGSRHYDRTKGSGRDGREGRWERGRSDEGSDSESLSLDHDGSSVFDGDSSESSAGSTASEPGGSDLSLKVWKL